MSDHIAQSTNALIRNKGAIEQSIGMQLLNPLAVFTIGFSSGELLLNKNLAQPDGTPNQSLPEGVLRTSHAFGVMAPSALTDPLPARLRQVPAGRRLRSCRDRLQLGRAISSPRNRRI